MTLETQLADVQEAIQRIETGAQSWTMAGGDGGSITVNEGNLADLYARERYLEQRIARRDRGGIKVVGGTPT